MTKRTRIPIRRILVAVVLCATLLLSAFAYADTLRLPQSLKRIEMEAFYGDTSLDEVIIPDGVTYIGERAFGDSSVKTVRFPNSVNYIANDAFSGVSSVTAYADAGSYAANWCISNNIIVITGETGDDGDEDTAEELTASTNFAIPTGKITEGSQYAFVGKITAAQPISKIVFGVYSSTKCIEQNEVVVNNKEYDLSTLTGLKLQLLPTGSYQFDVTVMMNDGKKYEHWKTSSFTIAAPSGVSENKSFDALFAMSSSVESASLAYTSVQFAEAAYSGEGGIKAYLQQYGFTNVTAHDYSSGTHTVGVGLGWKNIIDKDGNPKRLIAVICRGTSGSAEWKSNFTMGSGSYHTGFKNAAEGVFDWVCKDIINKLADDGLSTADCLVWTTGHSRGAAVSNLLAGHEKMLPSKFQSGQIYCYTFATPNVISSGNVSKSYIFNYIIGGDLVPRVPLNAWGYGRYGKNNILHNGETVYGIPVIDEGSMTTLCGAIGPKTIMGEIESQMGMGGAALNLAYQVFINQAVNVITLPSILETYNYIENTHQGSTYIAVMRAGTSSGYWTSGYLDTNSELPPSNFAGKMISSTEVELTWTPTTSNAYYEIRYDKSLTMGWSYSEVASGSRIVISGLEPNTSYAFDIAAMHDGKKSLRSGTIHVTTADYNLRGKAASTTSVTLNWDATPGFSEFEIRYDEAYTMGWSYSKRVSGTSATITGLDPGTQYAFDICGVRNGETATRSATVRVTTLGMNLKGTADSNTAITLTWDEVKGASSYEIRYDFAGAIGWAHSCTAVGTSITITDLYPDRKYAVDICPITNGVRGDRSPTIHVTTLDMELKGTADSATSVTLTWAKVANASNYEIRYDKSGTLGWSYSKTVSGTSATITGLEPGTEYAFDICASRYGQATDRSKTIYVTTKELKVPTNFRSTATTATSITLSWTAAAGADSYEVRYDKSYTLGWSYSKTTTDTSITITGLNPDTEYAFDVAAVQNGKLSDRSATIRVTTADLKAPTGFKGSAASSTSITLSWTAAAGADSYEIRFDEKGAIGWEFSKNTTDTSVTISGLEPDTDYAFDICSIRDGKKSDRSATIYVSTPSLNLHKTGSTATSITLAWNTAAGVDSYEIRYDTKDSLGWSYSKTTTSTSITITGLDPNTEYAFDICTVKSGNKSARSATIYASTLALNAPTGFKSTATTATSVTLSWTAATGADSYEIRYDKSGTWGWSYSKTVTGTSVTVTGLNPDTEYAFDICSIQNSKKSGRSATIYATTLELKAPTNFKGSSASTTSITLSWTAAEGAESYEVRYDKKGSSGWSYSKTTTGTSITITGLNPYTDYAFDICSVRDSKKSGRSSTIYVSTPSLNLHSTSTTATSVTLAWSAASGADSYEIRYDKKGTLTWRYSKNATGTSVTITGLEPGTEYAFDICAVKGSDKSTRSATVYASTLELKTPTNFKSTATTETSVTLSWTAATGASSYEIRYDKKNTMGWSYSKTTSSTSITITGLTPGTAYAFDICSVQDGKKSSRSDTIYATTLDLKAPTNFKASTASEIAINLSWTAAAGASSYEIRYDKKGTSGWSYSKTVTGTSVSISGLIPGTDYAFDICSVQDGQKSGRSSTIYASTSALKVPTNFKSTSTAVTSITLSWTGVTNAASYEIRYDKKGTLTWSGSKTTTGTSITITGLTPDTDYAFDICAVRSGAKSSRSTTIYATTKTLSAPTNFTGSANNVSSVTLKWTAATGAASYEIRYDTKGSIGWSNSKPTTGTSITITGLKPGTAYAFDICSVTDGKKSSRSDTIYVTTKSLTVPSSFAGTSSTKGAVSLSWGSVAGATYEIRYDLKGAWGWDYSTTSSSTSKTITGLTSGKTYAFQVRSVSGSNTGSWSSTIYVTIK